LVAISARQAVAARRVCHCRIASLPAEQLNAYRNRVETQARKWFEQGIANRDGRLLQRIVDEAFCSRYGDRAADLLGDWDFERGDFGAAERWWRMIVSPVDEDRPVDGAQAELVFPDTKLDVARVRAKQLLARHFQIGISGPAMATYRRQHAASKGKLAGKQGTYVEILEKIAGEATGNQAEENTSWPTFGGAMGRGTPATGAKNRLMGMLFRPPQYRFTLETHAKLERDAPYEAADRVLPNSVRNRAMAFHPVIALDHVIVADSHAVVAYPLKSGRPEVWFDAVRDLEGANHKPGSKLPARPDLRYTLSADGDCLYARLGTAELTAGGAGVSKPSYLVCLNLKPHGAMQRLRWSAAPDENRGGEIFEGAPLVHDGRVYIAAVRVDGGQTITSIRCYPTAGEGVGRAIWRRDVCITQELSGTAIRNRHHLLTLAGSRIVYCSHFGAIVALDAETGKSIWAVRYPSGGGTTLDSENTDAGGWNGDLAPCVYAAGRIFVAPADDKRLLCLDPMNGAVLWERGGIDIVHLLGVARGRLVFTSPQAIRAVDCTTGADIWQMPDVETSLAPAGRGLLADDLVFWPTSHGLKVLLVEDGRIAPDFPPGVLDEKLPAERLGNMVYADGCLAIAGLRELTLYLAPRRERAEREAEVRARPDSAEARLRLAAAQADGGDLRSALESLQRAEMSAAQEVEARRARDAMHGLLLESARRAEAGRDWAEAARKLEQASAGKFGTIRRAHATVQLATMWSRAEDWARAVVAWQLILDDPALRACRVEDPTGLPQNAAVLAGRRIEQIVKAHGAGVYARIEERARQQLDAAGKDRRAVVRELAAQFPNAAVICSAVREEDRASSKTSASALPVRGTDNGQLHLPLVRSWEVRLDHEEKLLVPPHSAGSVIVTVMPVADGARLTCRDSKTGAECWREALSFVPTWLEDNPNCFLVGGTKGVARLHPWDGRVLWMIPSTAGFNSFQTNSSQLILLEQGQLLIAVDALTGEVQWTRRAPGAGMGLAPPSGQFDPHYLLADNRILVQTGGGRIWLLDAARGKTAQEWVGYGSHRLQSPVRLEGRAGRVCIAPRPNRVSTLDLEKAQETWHYDLPHRGTLTGQLPQLAADAQSLFVIMPRNYGTALHRLNAADGYPQWPEERLLTYEHLDADQIAFDGVTIFYIAGNVVRAQSVANDRELWSLSIPEIDQSWSIRRAGDVLIVAPRFSFEPPPEKRGYIEWAPKLTHRMSPAGSRPQTLPLTIVDTMTGQLVQRLNFSVDGGTEAGDSQDGHRYLTCLFAVGAIIVRVPGTLVRFAPALLSGD
jgi:outer membrane protein assembly factor BamB